jgi:hypothetical protein
VTQPLRAVCGFGPHGNFRGAGRVAAGKMERGPAVDGSLVLNWPVHAKKVENRVTQGNERSGFDKT